MDKDCIDIGATKCDALLHNPENTLRRFAAQYAYEQPLEKTIERAILSVNTQIDHRVAAKEVLEQLLAQMNINSFRADDRARAVFEDSIRAAVKHIQSTL